MGELKVEERSIVTPGETMAIGMDYLPGEGTYRLGDDIKASVLGLANVRGHLMKVIPLSGRYIPKRRDVVIGVVNDIHFSQWSVDINSPYEAMIPVKEASERFIDTRRNDMSEFFAVGDVVLAEISAVDGRMNVNLTMRGRGLRKLSEGRLISVAPAKVPRIKGKGGSMINMIKQIGNCHIIVGQNGMVWLKGDSPEIEDKVIRVVRQIEEEAHTSGLTDKIRLQLGLPEQVSDERIEPRGTLSQEMASVDEARVHEEALVKQEEDTGTMEMSN